MDAETMVYLGMEWYPAWNRFISAKLLSVQLDVRLGGGGRGIEHARGLS